MSIIEPTDPDFRVSRIGFDTLLAIQREAEDRGFGTRWTSSAALRGQVGEEFVLLRSLMREKRDGVLRSYRCLVLYSAADGAGGITTVDLCPERFGTLERLDRDPDVRAAMTRMFDLALGGISVVPKL